MAQLLVCLVAVELELVVGLRCHLPAEVLDGCRVELGNGVAALEDVDHGVKLARPTKVAFSDQDGRNRPQITSRDDRRRLGAADDDGHHGREVDRGQRLRPVRRMEDVGLGLWADRPELVVEHLHVHRRLRSHNVASTVEILVPTSGLAQGDEVDLALERVVEVLVVGPHAGELVVTELAPHLPVGAVLGVAARMLAEPGLLREASVRRSSTGVVAGDRFFGPGMTNFLHEDPAWGLGRPALRDGGI